MWLRVRRAPCALLLALLCGWVQPPLRAAGNLIFSESGVTKPLRGQGTHAAAAHNPPHHHRPHHHHHQAHHQDAHQHHHASEPHPHEPTTRRSHRSEPSPYDADDTCHVQMHAGYDGHAFTWGMAFRTASAGECCDACRAHAARCAREEMHADEPPRKAFFHASMQQGPTDCGADAGSPPHFVCNTWVFCPEPLCWANDIHNHTFGECWLKYQEDPANPRAPSSGRYPDYYRAEHRTAPEKVQWMTGVVVSPGTAVTPAQPSWRKASDAQ